MADENKIDYEKELKDANYEVVVKSLWGNLKTFDDLCFLVEGYLGLDNITDAEFILDVWQPGLNGSKEWARWCVLMGRVLRKKGHLGPAMNAFKYALNFVENKNYTDLEALIRSEITKTR